MYYCSRETETYTSGAPIFGADARSAPAYFRHEAIIAEARLEGNVVEVCDKSRFTRVKLIRILEWAERRTALTGVIHYQDGKEVWVRDGL